MRTDTHRPGAADGRQSARTWLPPGGGPCTESTAASTRQGSATLCSATLPALSWYSMFAIPMSSETTSYLTTSSARACDGDVRTVPTNAAMIGRVRTRRLFALLGFIVQPRQRQRECNSSVPHGEGSHRSRCMSSRESRCAPVVGPLLWRPPHHAPRPGARELGRN